MSNTVKNSVCLSSIKTNSGNCLRGGITLLFFHIRNTLSLRAQRGNLLKIWCNIRLLILTDRDCHVVPPRNDSKRKHSHLLTLALLILYLAPAAGAVLIKDKQWPQNMVLNVVFLDGNQEQHQLIQKIAPNWLNKTSLSFKFYSNLANAPKNTHVRISFLLQSGSRLGNHQDYLSKDATMNLFDLSSGRLSKAGAKRLILHEFGHALGLIHEYRSPYWPYGEEVLMQILRDCYPKMERIGHNKQEAKTRCETINTPVDPKQAKKTAYDEFSVMNYPTTFTMKNGTNKTIKAHSKLSYLDQYAIQLWYSDVKDLTTP